MSNKGFTFGYKTGLNPFESENSYNYPGPGSYNLNESYETLYKPMKKTIGKGKRFSHDKGNSLMAPGIYNPKSPQITLPNITFTNSQRNSMNLIKNPYNIGPGSYDIDKFNNSKNNALPFINAENEELIRMIHDVNVNTPGPGSYEWETSANKGVSLVNYSMNSSKLPIKRQETIPGPGPGEYDLKNPLKAKSIFFAKADKNFQLDPRELNPNISPNTYDINPHCYDFLSKNNKQITYSFSMRKRMSSKHYFQNFESSNESPQLEEKNKKGIVFCKAERKSCMYNSGEKTTSGPGIYEKKDYWENLHRSQNAEMKMKEIIKKLQAKSMEKPLFNKESSLSFMRKTSMNKKLRPMIRMLTKSDFTSALLRREENNLMKNSVHNPLKSYILKKIQKNVEKILENKINKEIFILSNEAAKKRRNKGFTTSTRKYEFLTGNGQQSPGPDKYDIKRELNLLTLPLRLSKKIMIFDVQNDVPAPNSYNIESPIDRKSPKKNEKNKGLVSALRKIEEINKWKKVKKEEKI